ncbi:MAG: hypothetical protein Q8K79_04395 [Solirubrobacteraceae bacterium]|jgi:hypothetical protein|nr:hypothetical protein [Solirubrobacteraceae bacterium]
MTAEHRTHGRRRRALRPIGPAVLELVETLKDESDETIEIHLSAELAAAIARIDARDRGALNASASHPAASRTMTVDRSTARRWSSQAWRAVGEGRVAPAEAQALSDQLAPRGAA